MMHTVHRTEDGDRCGARGSMSLSHVLRGVNGSTKPTMSFLSPSWRVGSCAVERCISCSRIAYHSFTSWIAKLNMSNASMKIPTPWFRSVGCPFASKATAAMKTPSSQRRAMVFTPWFAKKSWKSWKPKTPPLDSTSGLIQRRIRTSGRG